MKNKNKYNCFEINVVDFVDKNKIEYFKLFLLFICHLSIDVSYKQRGKVRRLLEVGLK